MKLENLVWSIQAYDTYKFCLTAEQIDVLDLYLINGLQISEIAEIKKTSRQAVSKNVKMGLEKLAEFENNLHFLAWQVKMRNELEDLNSLLEQNNLDKAKKKLQELKKEI